MNTLYRSLAALMIIGGLISCEDESELATPEPDGQEDNMQDDGQRRSMRTIYHEGVLESIRTFSYEDEQLTMWVDYSDFSGDTPMDSSRTELTYSTDFVSMRTYDYENGVELLTSGEDVIYENGQEVSRTFLNTGFGSLSPTTRYTYQYTEGVLSSWEIQTDQDQDGVWTIERREECYYQNELPWYTDNYGRIVDEVLFIGTDSMFHDEDGVYLTKEGLYDHQSMLLKPYWLSEIDRISGQIHESLNYEYDYTTEMYELVSTSSFTYDSLGQQSTRLIESIFFNILDEYSYEDGNGNFDEVIFSPHFAFKDGRVPD